MAFKKYHYVVLVIALGLWVVAGVYYVRMRGDGGTEVGQQISVAQQMSDEPAQSPFSDVSSGSEGLPPGVLESAQGGEGAAVASEISDEWATYENKEFGYQVDYPRTYTPRDQGKIGTEVLNLTNFVTASGASHSVGVKVVVTSYQDLEKRMWKLVNSGYTVQAATIAGVDGLKVSGKRSGTEEMVYETLFPTSDGEHTVRIITSMEGVQEDYLKIFDQMAQSFSFL